MDRAGGQANPELREQSLVWEFFDFATEGFFMEVGAHDPKYLSQTWLLERVGWRGILVEPLPEQCELLRRERPGSKVHEVAVSSPDKTGTADFHVCGMFSSLEKNVADNRIRYEAAITRRVVTLDAILREENVVALDFLSLDTEGTEFDVLRGFDIRKYEPRLILIEDTVTGLDKHAHLLSAGYRLVRRTGSNNWYVPRNSPRDASILDRIRLFRKMYLGTPFRAFRFRRERRGMGIRGA
ncbi:MAG: FkbM family methyltransferase [Deltaproteobacteria bacterium]|nr:FkbM family methyltransferase [Deltaproteobacteria bacterium]